MAANGLITTVAGNGTNGYAGDGGAATNARFDNPSGVAADAFGNLFIADAGNGFIRKVDTNGVITTLVGGGNVSLNNPAGVAVDATGQPLHCRCGQRTHPQNEPLRPHHHGGGQRNPTAMPATAARPSMPALNNPLRRGGGHRAGNLYDWDGGQQTVFARVGSRMGSSAPWRARWRPRDARGRWRGHPVPALVVSMGSGGGHGTGNVYPGRCLGTGNIRRVDPRGASSRRWRAMAQRLLGDAARRTPP